MHSFPKKLVWQSNHWYTNLELNYKAIKYTTQMELVGLGLVNGHDYESKCHKTVRGSNGRDYDSHVDAI